MTNIIVAYDQQRAIGSSGDLPWGRSLPGDLSMFKRLTHGTSVIMGRKTFESIGRPLPGRENIVVSRNPRLAIEGVVCVNGLAQALAAASRPAFVIGGAELYEQTLPFAAAVYATEVQHTFDHTDTFFPELPTDEWCETYRVPHGNSPADIYDYDFVRYERTDTPERPVF